MSATKSWIIGTAPNCDVVVNDAFVSGEHCRLTQTSDGFQLEDLGSTNGTFVNGRQLTGARTVTPRDRITLGQSFPLPWPNGAGPQIIRIGRAADNDIVFNDPVISSHHAEITIDGPQITIRDLGSMNGTAIGDVDRTVNGETPLSRSDVVFLGTFRVSAAELIGEPAPESRDGATMPIDRSESTAMQDPASRDATTLRPPTVPSERNSVVASEPAAAEPTSRKPLMIGAAVGGGVLILAIVGVIFAVSGNGDADEDPPIVAVDAQDDEYSVIADGRSISFEVLDNDTSNGAQSKSRIVSVTEPSHGGEVKISSDGRRLSYTATVGFSGTESFTYSVKSGADDSKSSTATVNVSVTPVEPARAIYSVWVMDRRQENILEIGTAWAVSEKHLVTSAAVALLLHTLADDLPVVTVSCSAGGKEFVVTPLPVNEKYRQSEEAYQSANTEFISAEEKLRENAALDEEDPDRLSEAEIEAIKKEAIEAGKQRFVALYRRYSYDAALLELTHADDELPMVLPVADSAAHLKTRDRVTLHGVPCDSRDFQLAEDAPTAPVTIPARVVKTNWDNGTAEPWRRLIVRLDEHDPNVTFSGSPLFDETGQVIGIFTRTVIPVGDVTEPPNEHVVLGSGIIGQLLPNVRSQPIGARR